MTKDESTRKSNNPGERGSAILCRAVSDVSPIQGLGSGRIGTQGGARRLACPGLRNGGPLGLRRWIANRVMVGSVAYDRFRSLPFAYARLAMGVYDTAGRFSAFAFGERALRLAALKHGIEIV